MNTLDQIYADFTTKLLPTVQEGLSITKDYFVDIFGRYVEYLIIHDIIRVCFSLLFLACGIAVFVATLKSWKRRAEWANESSRNERFAEFFFFGVSATVIFIALLAVASGIDNLIKDIYIPEVRIIEQIKLFSNKL